MESPGRNGSPRRRRTVDRFIPHREGVNLEAAYSVSNSSRQAARQLGPAFGDGNVSEPLDDRSKEAAGARMIYSTLLKSELFGDNNLSLPLSSSASSLSSPTSRLSVGNTTNPVSAGSGATFPSSNSHPSNLSTGSGLTSSNSYSSLLGTPRPSLSLPTSPRKPRMPPSASTSTLRFSPQRLIRNESDLSDITMGGGSVSAGGTGLRPETLDLLQRQQIQPSLPAWATPARVLDAPGLVDDFYLNLLHWGSQDYLAVGLGRCAYIWVPRTESVIPICKMEPDEYVTSVSWMYTGEHLAVGSSSGSVRIVDALTAQTLRTMAGHTARAGVISWNDHIVSTGSADHSILHRDCRVKEHYIARLNGHRGEVCGLRWNTDLQQLASGGNDNKLRIWSGVHNYGVSESEWSRRASDRSATGYSGSGIPAAGSAEPLYVFDEHTSAVKALAWSPHQRGLLASGGGFCDRKIWFWNTLSGKSLNSVDTGSQVCALEWNPRSRELISSQGSQYNDVAIWKYPRMQTITRLRGHTQRVLYMGISPDGRMLATGSSDETLRLWSLYDDRSAEDSLSTCGTVRQLR